MKSNRSRQAAKASKPAKRDVTAGEFEDVLSQLGTVMEAVGEAGEDSIILVKTTVIGGKTAILTKTLYAPSEICRYTKQELWDEITNREGYTTWSLD